MSLIFFVVVVFFSSMATQRTLSTHPDDMQWTCKITCLLADTRDFAISINGVGRQSDLLTAIRRILIANAAKVVGLQEHEKLKFNIADGHHMLISHPNHDAHQADIIYSGSSAKQSTDDLPVYMNRKAAVNVAANNKSSLPYESTAQKPVKDPTEQSTSELKALNLSTPGVKATHNQPQSDSLLVQILAKMDGARLADFKLFLDKTGSAFTSSVLSKLLPQIKHMLATKNEIDPENKKKKQRTMSLICYWTEN